jgi:hypothetical protein
MDQHLHQKKWAADDPIEALPGERTPTERVLRDSIGMVLHQLNGFIVFSLSSLSAAFQR